jgi:hypothetical protein
MILLSTAHDCSVIYFEFDVIFPLTAGSNNKLKGRISEYTAGRNASRQNKRFRILGRDIIMVVPITVIVVLQLIVLL